MGNIVIRKDDDIVKIRDRMKSRLRSVKSLKTTQYLGKLKLRYNGLEYQKQIRNEWNRNEHID